MGGEAEGKMLINPPLTSCGLLLGSLKNSVDCHHKGHIVLSHKTPLQQQFDGE